jgi:ubiquinone/menaquinone biosynthesis C-methylase UbiE
MGFGDRFKAAFYDTMSARFEKEVGASKRTSLLAGASGRVLEIGGGTGHNLTHYPDQLDELIVTEPNEAMRRRAQRRLEESGRAATLLQASAEALPFPDDSFDTVVSTLVLCTVPDQNAALREVHRVLKPGGKLLFVEHVRSDHPKRAKWQDRLDRPWKVVGDGCHPNRDTLAALRTSGFEIQLAEQGEMPKFPRLIRPYILGQAIKR